MLLNGNLKFIGAGEVQNLRIENLLTDPSTPVTGQLWYNSSSGKLKYFDGTVVHILATGGNADALQAELDDLEFALGMNSDGTLPSLSSTVYMGGATTLLGALTALDTQLSANAAADAAEVAARTAADATLTSNLATEVSDRTAADATLTSNLAAEVAARTAADTTLTSNLATEVSDRTAADAAIQSNLDTESAARIAADATLTTNLATEVAARIAGDAAVQSNLDTESAARIAADATLTTNLAAEVAARTAADATLTANLATEVADRTAADAVLQSNIDAVNSQVTSLGNAFNYVGTLEGGVSGSGFDLETLASEGKDTGDYYKVTVAGFFKVGAGAEFYANTNDGLIFNSVGGVDKIDSTNSTVAGTANQIDVAGSTDTGFVVSINSVFSGRVSSLESGVADETAARIAADAVIQSGLDTEVAARTAADATLTANLATEVAARIAGDAAVQSNLDTEVAARTAADATLTANLATEVADRTAADATLTANLATEVTDRTAADATLTANLATEVVDRTAADATLTANLATEVADRTAADATLTDNLAAEVAARIAAGSASSTRLEACFFVYDGNIASTSHVVNHGISKYCNVTVVDSTDEVVIPQSIKYDSASQLTVTFNSAITCKIVVSGLKAVNLP